MLIIRASAEVFFFFLSFSYSLSMNVLYSPQLHWMNAVCVCISIIYLIFCSFYSILLWNKQSVDFSMFWSTNKCVKYFLFFFFLYFREKWTMFRQREYFGLSVRTFFVHSFTISFIKVTHMTKHALYIHKYMYIHNMYFKCQKKMWLRLLYRTEKIL